MWIGAAPMPVPGLIRLRLLDSIYVDTTQLSDGDVVATLSLGKPLAASVVVSRKLRSTDNGHPCARGVMLKTEKTGQPVIRFQRSIHYTIHMAIIKARSKLHIWTL